MEKYSLKSAAQEYYRILHSRILQGRYSFCSCCLSELLPIGSGKTWGGGDDWTQEGLGVSNGISVGVTIEGRRP